MVFTFQENYSDWLKKAMDDEDLVFVESAEAEELGERIVAYFDSLQEEKKSVHEVPDKVIDSDDDDRDDRVKWKRTIVTEKVWKEMPTYSWVAFCLELTTTELRKFIEIFPDEKKVRIVKQAIAFIEAMTHNAATEKKISGQFVMFDLKNNYNWKDETVHKEEKSSENRLRIEIIQPNALPSPESQYVEVEEVATSEIVEKKVEN